jgi:hypothetical protein
MRERFASSNPFAGARLLCARTCQVRYRQKARHKGAGRHQPVHKRADDIQGETSSEDHQGSPGKSRQRRGGLAACRT